MIASRSWTEPAHRNWSRREALVRGLALGAAAGTGALALLAGGCSNGAKRERVVVYCSVDDVHARPILEAYAKRAGVDVLPVFDTEATKVTGLVNRILSEQDRPGCDIWWSSEPLGTIRLARAGVLAPAGGATVGSKAQRLWTPTARRVREVIVHTKYVPEPERPRTLADLTDPKWRGRVAIPRPQFGSMRTHLAAVLAAAGEERVTNWLMGLKANDVQLLDGNAGVARAVADGRSYVGLVDNDDTVAALGNGWPVWGVPVDSRELVPRALRKAGEAPVELGSKVGTFEGVVQLPFSVAMVKNGPAARSGNLQAMAAVAGVFEHLCSESVDEALTKSEYATYPARPVPGDIDARGRTELTADSTDWERVADMDALAVSLADRILGN